MSAKKLARISPDHIIQFNGIHDSEIIGLVLVENRRSLEITLKAESGSLFKVYLNGIRRLSCNGFRTQNVVFRMLASTKINVKKEIQDLQKDLELSNTDVEDLNKEIESGKLCLFQVDASVGCDISCICEKIEIEG
jgi:hypothetical protein